MLSLSLAQCQIKCSFLKACLPIKNTCMWLEAPVVSPNTSLSRPVKILLMGGYSPGGKHQRLPFARLFVFHLIGCFFHFRLDIRKDFFGIPFEKPSRCPGTLRVFFLADIAGTRSGTLPDIMVQTRPFFTDIFRQISAAGSELINTFNRCIHSRTEETSGYVRNISLIPCFLQESGAESFADSQLDIRISLVILQHRVICDDVL